LAVEKGKIAEIIERQIRPDLHKHGGDVELVEITADGLVKVKLTGACSSCPGAQQTLTEVIEARLKAAAPEIKGVVLTQQINEELLQEALKILRKENMKK